MLILLPPSEGKTTPDGDGSFDPEALVFADHLGESRARVLDGLTALCGGPEEAAIETLGISPGQAGEVSINAELRSATAGPASTVYTGVLYEHLDFPGLSAPALNRAESSLLIASGLWGFLRPSDRIPRYRFSMKPKLRGVGGLAAFWRPALAEAMNEAGHDREESLVLDLRSGAYSAAWKPRRAGQVSIRAFRVVDGVRKPISHMAKAIRGDVARIVLEAPDPPENIGDLRVLIEGAGMTVEPGPGSLDVTVRET